MKYLSRPRVVEAFQITEESLKDPGSWPKWLLEAAFTVDSGAKGAFWRENGWFRVGTHNGNVPVTLGDFIICGSGELYPCNSTTFFKNYEEVI